MLPGIKIPPVVSSLCDFDDDFNDSAFNHNVEGDNILPDIKCYHIMKLACIRWRSIGRTMRVSCSDRAKDLNSRILSGEFTSVPACLKHNFI